MAVVVLLLSILGGYGVLSHADSTLTQVQQVSLAACVLLFIGGLILAHLETRGRR